jgi:prepilin-type N-terminal cleavage/methylation domain-containing protein
VNLWKNERGLTLTELLAAVVLLGLVVVPLTNLGTTALRWHREDAQKNEAVVLADSKMIDIKRYVMQNGRTLPSELIQGTFPSTDLTWQVITEANSATDLPLEQVNGIPLPELVHVELVVHGPDLEHGDNGQRAEITRLETVVRVRESR